MVGFGILNLDLLYEETNLPVVVVLTRLPDFSKIKKALMNFSDSSERWKLIENAGQPFSLNESKEIYLQVKGITEKVAKDLVIASTGKGKLPECLRIAHLVASSFKTL